MDYMENLKELGKIGKSMLVQLAGLVENYKQVQYEEKIDYKNCNPDCPFYEYYKNNPEDFSSAYCTEHCRKNISLVPKTVYNNEKNVYRLQYSSSRLSKMQIKQLMLYHFMDVDSNGFIKYISINNISKILNCNAKTVLNNNMKFVSLGLIALSKIDNKLFNLKLIGYDRYHLNKYDGGTGYVVMSKELLMSLMELKNVNSLRLEIRKLIKVDNDSLNNGNKDASSYTYKEIKRFLPGYIDCAKIKNEIASKHASAFDTIIDEDHVEFKLLEEFNGKILKSKKQTVYTEKYKDILTDWKFDEKDLKQVIDDLVQMSFEYGFDKVAATVKQISSSPSKNEVDSICKLTRHLIKASMYEKITA